jgi:hypothetical protein
VGGVFVATAVVVGALGDTVLGVPDAVVPGLDAAFGAGALEPEGPLLRAGSFPSGSFPSLEQARDKAIAVVKTQFELRSIDDSSGR